MYNLSAYDVGKKDASQLLIKTWTNKSLIKWDISKSCTLKKEVGVHTFN